MKGKLLKGGKLQTSRVNHAGPDPRRVACLDAARLPNDILVRWSVSTIGLYTLA